MTTTFPPFFTGMMIVLISHFLLKHYLLYLPPDIQVETPDRKRVRFRDPLEEYPVGFGSIKSEQSAPNTFETVDVKGELLKFVKDYGKDDYLPIDNTSGVEGDTDDLKEFFEIGTDSLSSLDITRDIERPIPGNSVNGFDSFEMNDNYALYGKNPT